MSSATSDPPEIVFHRYFSGSNRHPKLQHIRGKQDLGKLSAELETLLAGMQSAFNQSFANSSEAMAALGLPVNVHFDYLESETANAHAFEDQGYQFIGITIPMIERLLNVCHTLVQSERVAALLKTASSADENQRAIGALFTIQLMFLAGHEFGHHFWRHSEFRPQPWNEMEGGGSGGSLRSQSEENLADSYAVFISLDFLMESPQRRDLLNLLGHSLVSEVETDPILMSSFLLAAFGFFSLGSQTAIDSSNIYTLTHPPAVARLNGIIQTSRVWSRKYRPGLDAWLTEDRLQEIIHASDHAVTGGRGMWDKQIDFFRSSDGLEYYRRLGEMLSSMTPPRFSPRSAPDITA